MTVEDVGGNMVTTATNGHPGHRDQPRRHAGLHHQPARRHRRHGLLRRLQDHRQGGELHPDRRATGLTGATSSAFTITPGTATQLVFTTQPGGGADGATWTTQPAVSIEDASGNVVTTATNHHPGHRDQPRRHAGLHHQPLGATGGTSSFAGCKITGTLRQLHPDRLGHRPDRGHEQHLPITIGAASQLAFTTQPGGGANGATWTTQPVVTVQDAGGNTVTTSTDSITLAITTQPGSGARSACTTNPQSASGGVASFAGCKITGKAGSYTLTATATGLTRATSYCVHHHRRHGHPARLHHPARRWGQRRRRGPPSPP